MARLDPEAGYVTLINTFSVEPGNASKLEALLVSATEQTMRHLPGFVSANLHVSLDGRHVANYAQWRSRADFEAMLNDPGAQSHMREATKLANSFQPVLYELRHAITAESGR